MPNQAEYESRIQKCLLDNPDLPVEFIKEVLESKNQDHLLAEVFIFEDKDE